MASTPPAGSDQPTPDWDKFPNLENVVTKADIETKPGRGAQQYVPWMKIMAMLSEHAPGWHFDLREDCDPTTGIPSPLYKAGDGSAYIKGYFRAPKGSHFDDTPELRYPVMGERPKLKANGEVETWSDGKPKLLPNSPIPHGEITARDLTDADRRCRAAAAAAFFRLGWQLWTKDSIENPYREQEPAPAPKAAPKKAASSNKAVNTPPQADQTATAGGPSVQEQVAAVLRPLFDQQSQKTIDAWRAKYKAQFKLSADVANITGANITTPEQFAFTENFLNEFIKANPA